MQISKTLLTCGAVALCLVANSARAVDTEADIKLREALRQRMAEVGPEQDTPAKPVKPAKVKAPKAPKAAKAAPAPVVTEPAPVAPAPVAAQVEVAPAPVAPAPVVYESAPATVPASVSSEEDRLREAVRARLAAGETTATVAEPVVTNGTDLQPVVTTTTIVAPTPPPAPVAPAPAPAPVAPTVITAPPSPISATKEQRLAALLQQYKADLITPQKYHEERAKILAE